MNCFFLLIFTFTFIRTVEQKEKERERETGDWGLLASLLLLFEGIEGFLNTIQCR